MSNSFTFTACGNISKDNPTFDFILRRSMGQIHDGSKEKNIISLDLYGSIEIFFIRTISANSLTRSMKIRS